MKGEVKRKQKGSALETSLEVVWIEISFQHWSLAFDLLHDIILSCFIDSDLIFKAPSHERCFKDSTLLDRMLLPFSWCSPFLTSSDCYGYLLLSYSQLWIPTLFQDFWTFYSWGSYEFLLHFPLWSSGRTSMSSGSRLSSLTWIGHDWRLIKSTLYDSLEVS